MWGIMLLLPGHGQDAAMRQIAIGALKLNRSVMDVMAAG
jgi:hypothetical protein